MMGEHKNYTLLHNSRFYILAFSVLLSLVLCGLLRLTIPSDQLFYIRLQQLFGLLCVLYWYTALIISPLGYAIGKQRVRYAAFARRAIGVSAAYFAFLHAGIALWGQLGGIGQITYLPVLFKWSLVCGAIAIVVLSLLAATSFDKVIRFMTFRKWKWLHRLIYAGGILAVLHIWTIGTHLAYSSIQWAAFGGLIVLAGLETYRTITLLAKKYPELQSRDYFLTLFVGVWAFWIVLVAALPAFVQNYHNRHTDHADKTHSGRH